MDNTLTLGLTPEEFTQLQTLLDEAAAELKRIRERKNQRQPSKDPWQIRVERKLAHIDESLAQLEAKYNA